MIDALSHIGLCELPNEWDGKTIWLKAIALVHTSNGIMSYVCMAKDAISLKDKVVMTFGDTGAIMRIETIYPYEFLRDEFSPIFTSKKKEERIEYLVRICPEREEEFRAMNFKTLEEEVVKVSINAQIEHDKKHKR